MKNPLLFLLGASVATCVFLLLIKSKARTQSGLHNIHDAERMKPYYADLEAASNPNKIREALGKFRYQTTALGPIHQGVSRKVFRFLKERSHDETDCYLVGHLAAVSGDTELFRKMIRTYFGSAEGELKGTYVEEFLQYNPDLFFSLPDTWHLWRAAGGAEWCCDHPEITIPIVTERANSTKDAKRILKDIEDAARGASDTQWGTQALRILHGNSDGSLSGS